MRRNIRRNAMIPPDSSTVRHSATAGLAAGDLPDRPTMANPSAGLVGVVGLGQMGAAFAVNLVADGRRVLAYDRDPAHMEAVRAAGGEPARQHAAPAPCDFILTALPDDGALADVALHSEGLVQAMRPGAVHISMSTVSPGL